MAKIGPFEEHALEYDAWFERNRYAYQSELDAIRKLLPRSGNGVEIGVGTGRFAAPLGVSQGVEPSAAMRSIAEGRGINTLDGIAEALPYENASFDFALMVTTICFVDDPLGALDEAYRVLKPAGTLLVGLVDRDSPLGRAYEVNSRSSVFYRDARFFSVDEAVSLMRAAGFEHFSFCQTVFGLLHEIQNVQPVEEGYGRGSFVVIAARKKPVREAGIDQHGAAYTGE
jgi:SAM-dependent methyltransferase